MPNTSSNTARGGNIPLLVLMDDNQWLLQFSMKHQAFLGLTVALTLRISLCSTNDLAQAQRKFDMVCPKLITPIHNFL